MGGVCVGGYEGIVCACVCRKIIWGWGGGGSAFSGVRGHACVCVFKAWYLYMGL